MDWDIEALGKGWKTNTEIVKPINIKDMNEFLQLTMDIESYGGKDIYQQGASSKQRGAGLFSLETGPDQGGMTRLTQVYKGLPKELTPSALERHFYQAARGDRSYDVKAKLHPSQQKYLMTAHIMMNKGGRKAYDKWVSGGKKQEDFLDWWADFHWKGHGGDSTIRKNKIDEVKINLDAYEKKRKKNTDTSFFFPDDRVMNEALG